MKSAFLLKMCGRHGERNSIGGLCTIHAAFIYAALFMKIIRSTLTAMLMALSVLALATLGLAACGSQQEDAVSVLHHFNTGNEAYRIEDYRRAIIHFTQALELDGSSPDIQYNLGLAYYRSGNYEEAVSAFTAALKARPTMIDAHYNLALAHDRLFNADAAHTHYNIYRRMVSSRKKSRAGAGRGSAAANSAVGMSAGGLGGRAAGGTMLNGAAAPGGRSPVSLNGGAAARGRPIPKIKPTGRNAVPSGLRAQGLGQGKQAGRRATNRPPPQARRVNTRAAYSAAPAPAQNSNNASGEETKWWTQDRFNRTR